MAGIAESFGPETAPVRRSIRRLVLAIALPALMFGGPILSPALGASASAVSEMRPSPIPSNAVMISSWTTYFQPAAHNGFGANIWIPAETIDDYVVKPGATFNFWNAVGPVTLAKGYKLGGAIVDGHTEEGVAIGGGICSTSTTLFNAALRAGFKMGQRENHFYYINRYPVGLDATVSKDGNSVQNMTWVNDTPNAVLIRGLVGPNYVRFQLWGVPTGRTVTLSTPIVTNYAHGYTQYVHTSAIPDGSARQIEYADDGFDSSVTRTVRDAHGNVVHRETYYSHYAMIVGTVLIGDHSAPYVPVPPFAP